MNRVGVLCLFASVGSIALFAQGCAAEPEDEPASGEEAAVSSSASPDRIFDAPFYFSVPKAAITVPLNRPLYPYPTVWNPSTEVADAGLRAIVIHQGGQEPSKKRAARIDMARRLAKAGVLQDGDLALTFRPSLAGTMAYPHVQMGITHASLVYTRDGEAFNIDSPLDGEYVGQFSTVHFTGGTTSTGERDEGTDALQIVRPRAMDDARKAKLRTWIGTLESNLGRINGVREQVKFQSNYLTPIFASKQMTTKQTVTTLGRIILEDDQTTKLPMYCSEFAWHMLALSSCSAEEIRAAGPEGADCVAPVFEPMPLVTTADDAIGLAEGPLQSLLLAPSEQRAELVSQVFATRNATKLSSGHRAVAEQVAPLMDGLATYYGAKAEGAPPAALADGAARLNAGVGGVGNYSPTAFLVETTLPAGVRSLDYVVTVVFVDSKAELDKAKRLAQQPVP